MRPRVTLYYKVHAPPRNPPLWRGGAAGAHVTASDDDTTTHSLQEG